MFKLSCILTIFLAMLKCWAEVSMPWVLVFLPIISAIVYEVIIILLLVFTGAYIVWKDRR